MQYIRGKLARPDDLIILLDVLKEKKGKVKLQMPYYATEIYLCYDGKHLYLNAPQSTKSPRFALKRFLEEWITTNIQPIFEFFEGEICREGSLIREEEISELIHDPNLKKVKSIPEHFEITKAAVEEVPSFLIAYWKTRKPLGKNAVYDHELTLSELVRLIDRGLIRIKPYKMVESMPLKLRVLLMAVISVSIIYLLLPLNFISLGMLKYGEVVNWSLRNKVLGIEDAELPVEGCFKSKFHLRGDEVINPGLDGKVGTDDDLRINLPKKGYTPTFTVPAK
jgi:hypothetical protein